MSNSLASTDIDAEYTLYFALIATMVYAASASALAMYQQAATSALKAWYSARLTLLKLDASSAQSYSNGVGMSVARRERAEASASVAQYWAGFVQLLAQGGVTVPTVDDAAVYWDLSGVGNG